MKHLLLTLTILISPFFSKSQSNNTFTISQIGWSFTPPPNFELLDSSAENHKLSEKITIWKKNLFFHNPSDIKTIIAFSIISGNNSEEQWYQTRPNEIKGSYKALTNKYQNLSFDSSTTSIKIDGIDFQKFSMIGKENGILKYSHIQLARFYKGYKINFVYSYENPTAGAEIEKQILNSKFSK